MKRATAWKTAPISSTCEVMTSPDYLREPCGKPTACAYPAMGGGWMALCAQHGEKHSDISTPIGELLSNGETLR